MSRNYEPNRFYGVRPALFIQPLSQQAAPGAGDEELEVELDEPPDHQLSQSPQSYEPPALPSAAKPITGRVYNRQPPTPLSRQCSLLTQGLLSTSSLNDLHPAPVNLMARAGSQASSYSLTSNHGLTSDCGFSSPGHSGTPSPPLPAAMQIGVAAAPVSKPRTIKFAGERQPEPAESKPAPEAAAVRKPRISFACCPLQPPQAEAKSEKTSEPPKRACTIRFACNAKSIEVAKPKPVTSPRKQVSPEAQSTPRRSVSPFPANRRHRGSQSTPVAAVPDAGRISALEQPKVESPTERRRIEKERLKKLGSTRPEDEAWIHEIPKPRKPITVTDTLRKENAIRQLAAEAEQEALEEALDDMIDDDDDDDDEEEEEDDDDEEDATTGSRYMAYGEDESDGGHETDDEGGFAESDDDSDDDPEFQFWTNGHSTAATSADHHHHVLEVIRPKHNRTVSESSFDGARLTSSPALPMPSFRTRDAQRRRSPRPSRMRPGTPELPDSTDFVCGTLDEDRPLEEAYLSCLKQRKLEKQGIIPQDLDPSFPTSDPENNDEEDELTEGVASTASDHHFLGGRFDESEGSQDGGPGIVSARMSKPTKKPARADQTAGPKLHIGPSNVDIPSKMRSRSPAPAAMQRIRTKSPAPVAMQRTRTKSPAPVIMQRARTKSPAPVATQPTQAISPASTPLHEQRARSPAPRMLFDHSPIRPVSPLIPVQIRSPPASPKNIKIQTAGLAQRPGHVRTASLPHTPNPFFVLQERRLRSSKKTVKDTENHDRGPIDIKQGLEERKQRRKEHYWRKHCRDHKDKNRRCAPGKGAERMRELGLEMAHRNKAYGQKLELMLSV